MTTDTLRDEISCFLAENADPIKIAEILGLIESYATQEVLKVLDIIDSPVAGFDSNTVAFAKLHSMQEGIRKLRDQYNKRV